jgi:hypothetical protein
VAPVVPGFVPFALLLALEAASIFVWFLVFARRPNGLRALLVCPRCARLHEGAEAVARVADAVAVGSLAFLIALPFVAAGYESRFAFLQILLAISAVAAVLAVGAEVDFFARAVAARLLPNFTWSVDPARLVGGGARWIGVILSLYLFQHPDLPGSGIVGLFGGVGARLARDLPSTSAIYVAAALLLVAAIVALAARWLLPFALNSLPLTMATSREPHGRSV